MKAVGLNLYLAAPTALGTFEKKIKYALNDIFQVKSEKLLSRIHLKVKCVSNVSEN